MTASPLNRKLSIAPMLDWTDRHCRYFLRQITSNTLLYTEMVTTGALLHRDPARFLDFHVDEHPIALQLGGSEPNDLAKCSSLADDWGYDEINLNVGCPSDRVQNGRFGACLMASPELVAESISAMVENTSRPVTIKHRIGIDEKDSYDELCRFVEVAHDAGCAHFLVHARKAWLQGLSPKQNREVPPLRYELVHRLKADFPTIGITINGGLKTLKQVETQLESVDGAMIGREAYHNPWILAEADKQIFGLSKAPLSRHQVIENMQPYIEQQQSKGVHIKHITRHILGLFQGVPGARAWRRHLSENAHKADASSQVIHDALQLVPRQEM